MTDLSKKSTRSLTAATADQTSPASAIHQLTTAVAGFSKFESITFLATITGATGGALDVLVEHSPDGTNWYEFVHFAQATAAAAAKTYVYTPDPHAGAIVQVGKNLTTTMVLGAAAGAGGQWFDQLRLRYVAGASTSAGAAQEVLVICGDEDEQ